MPGRLARVALGMGLFTGAGLEARFEYGDDDESHGGMLRLSKRF